MDFKQLEAFQAVLDEGSYSEAGRFLYVSQPTISVRIKALQEELGVILFKQNGRKVQATLAGRILSHYVSDILKLQRNAVQAIHDTKDMTRKNIRISTTSTGTYILPMITKVFQQSFPETRLFLSISNSDSVVNQLFEGKTDIGVIASPVEYANLSSEVIGNASVVLVASPEHPLAKKDKISIQDLHDQCFIIREPGSDTRKRFEIWCKQYHFYPTNYIEMDQQEAIRLAVLDKLGIAVMSKFILESDSHGKSLKVLNTEGFPIDRPLQVLMHPDNQENVYNQAFIQYLKEHLDPRSLQQRIE
ncbi:LysR family transcriptional regulator [Paenibacillus sp.]|uniref:LysR family transcriptional regulator n=1 Tax=Paenibacillus sp. TaxID=58172 RepID=UPI00282A8712|nr:LysR family transcriptional regulator [Paenibacillus sp.]MDR0271647.1 LysR family transcriptional regulator [Paenibacillus sp.]